MAKSRARVVQAAGISRNLRGKLGQNGGRWTNTSNNESRLHRQRKKQQESPPESHLCSRKDRASVTLSHHITAVVSSASSSTLPVSRSLSVKEEEGVEEPLYVNSDANMLVNLTTSLRTAGCCEDRRSWHGDTDHWGSGVQCLAARKETDATMTLTLEGCAVNWQMAVRQTLKEGRAGAWFNRTVI